MKVSGVLFTLAFMFLICLPASGDVVFRSATGHYYEVVGSTLDWDQAKAAAESREHMGMRGYLVTITSQEEQDFINANLDYLAVWIGGMKTLDWGWVSGEAWGYTNWDDGEPNNQWPVEDIIDMFGAPAERRGKWNDERRYLPLAQYMVEYEMAVLGPNGGERLVAGQVHKIRWTGDPNNVPQVVLHYSPNNGTDWYYIDTTANDGDYEWVIPTVNSNECLVRVTGVGEPGYTDISDGVFTIFECERGYRFFGKFGEDGSGVKEFKHPGGGKIGPDGRYYVADAANGRIQIFVLNMLTGDYDYVAQIAGVGECKDVAVDGAGNVYLTAHPSVKKYVTSDGINYALDTQWSIFNGPHGICFDAAWNIYVADMFNHRVMIYDGVTWSVFAGTGSVGTGLGEFDHPLGIAIDNLGNIFVGERENHRVQIYNGTAWSIFAGTGSAGSGEGEFNRPGFVATDGQGYVYITELGNLELGNHRVQKFYNNLGLSVFISQWGFYGSGDGEFDAAAGIAVRASKEVIVVDSFNNRIQIFKPRVRHQADFNCDGKVNLIDFSMFCSWWLWDSN